MDRESSGPSWGDGADGTYDDGPIASDWPEGAPKTPEKKPESGWDSLSDYARKYNESMREKMHEEYSAISKGYLDAEDAAKAEAAAVAEAEDKAKWVNGRSWAKMVHWYKNHLSELTDIMYVGAEYDEDWYRKHPEAVADLTRDFLAKERELAARILAENDGLIDEKAAMEAARRQLHDEYIKSLEKAKGDGAMGDRSDKPGKDPKATGEDSKEGDDVKSEKVDIGDIELKKVNEALEKADLQRLEQLEGQINKLLPNLAELYAKNRRLFVGKENKADFEKARGQFSELLDEYLRLKAKRNHNDLTNNAMNEINNSLESRIKTIRDQLVEFAGGDLEHPKKSQAEIDAEKQRLINEANEAIKKEYGELMSKVKTEVTAGFIDDFIKTQIDLENATIDALDNGSFCRKVVHNIINNKALKAVLIGAGIAGLAVTGIGLATGAATLAFSLTAGGALAGAAKGFGSALLMSRQDSRNSNIRGFGERDRQRLEELFKNIDILQTNGESPDVKNLAAWVMSEYNEANLSDRRTNVGTIKPAIISGALATIMSGFHFNKTVQTTQTSSQVVGYTPDQYNVDISKVDIPHDHGMYETFAQLGGDPSNRDLAVQIAWGLDAKYGLVPGSNGIAPGFNGSVGAVAHTYDGPIANWPATAQAYIKEVVQEWAKNGLIPAIKIAGQPIYNTVSNMVTSIIPDQFRNFIARGLEAIIPAGIGGIMGGRNRRTRSEGPVNPIPVPEATSEDEPEKPTEPESTEDEPKTTTESDEEPTPSPTSPEGPSEEEIMDRIKKAENDYDEALDSASDILGGKERIEEFFRNDAHSDGEFLDYWESLSPEGQELTRTILNAIPDSEGTWRHGGSNFKNFLKYYDDSGVSAAA
ncbi:MAG: hypothetical protein Q4A70_01795 [Candidatus Saccharibacteria bacterium]|nr:hypothetical protein [Candidatus Saccharibacteria bacterium]